MKFIQLNSKSSSWIPINDIHVVMELTCWINVDTDYGVMSISTDEEGREKIKNLDNFAEISGSPSRRLINKNGIVKICRMNNSIRSKIYLGCRQWVQDVVASPDLLMSYLGIKEKMVKLDLMSNEFVNIDYISAINIENSEYTLAINKNEKNEMRKANIELIEFNLPGFIRIGDYLINKNNISSINAKGSDWSEIVLACGMRMMVPYNCQILLDESSSKDVPHYLEIRQEESLDKDSQHYPGISQKELLTKDVRHFRLQCPVSQTYSLWNLDNCTEEQKNFLSELDISKVSMKLSMKHCIVCKPKIYDLIYMGTGPNSDMHTWMLEYFGPKMFLIEVIYAGNRCYVNANLTHWTIKSLS